uniref:uncharacterized protein LOC120341990 n=1 Tax=Styela clava TaxID=7725 RepID=UPI001939756B|nr:uncharacterized protein LOC120341990 [Styela clava]
MKLEMIADEEQPLWNGYLYQLQGEAPRPKAVLCNKPEAKIGRPPYFGDECHGLISREDGDILCQEEGNFLIRESQNERGRYTLVLRILGAVKNFKLYWEDGQHFVGDKRFDNIYDLVEDGLITMYVEEKAHDYIQNMAKDRSVYSSLSRARQLLTQHLPNYGQLVPPVTNDRRMSPRRVPSIRNSPRHAHNGRNTESAALPYTHYQNQAAIDQYSQASTAALENQMTAARIITEESPYFQDSSYSNPTHVGSSSNSMIHNLMCSRAQTFNSESFQNGGLRVESNGGTKKSLTPTSSDERKRPRAKKVATEETVQQHHYEAYNQLGQGSPMHVRQPSPMATYDHSRTPSNSSGSNTDSEGRKRYPSKPNVPMHLQNRPFHQSVPNASPQRSPMIRNNSDTQLTLSSISYQCSMPAQHTHTNVAHVRQLGGSQGGRCIANMSNVPAHVNLSANGRLNSAGSEEKIVLDANDNQMYLSTATPQSRSQLNHSPSRARSSPRHQGFDSSSGSDAIPAKTFHQLKMFQKRLEEASDDDIRKEAQDEVSTLRGHHKTPVRLTRSHTTAGMMPIVRPHSGGKAPPKQTPRDIHCRQRSEPVELFQNHQNSPRRSASVLNSGVQDSATYRQQQASRNIREQYLTTEQNLISELRAASGGSCDSSLSSISMGSSQQQQQQTFYKSPDSISRLSSEEWTGEDRESSPSPHSTSQRSCSSDDNSLSSSRDGRNPLARQNAVITTEASWQRRLAEERTTRVYEDRNKNGSAPMGMVVNNKTACVPPLESLNASKPRRKSSDFDTATRQNAGLNAKPRHHSETSSEEGVPRHLLPSSAHKPLQRRATTGSPNKKASAANGSVPTIKEGKKLAQRSNSGPSPRKGKKSPDCPMSPRAQHIHHQPSLSSPRNDNIPYYDKEHVFKSHTYRGWQWCEYCGNFMWGIIQQGMQCRDCGLNVHKQCSKLVPGDCQPALKHVKTVFGIDLTALVKLHGTEIPIVIDKCIEEIEKRGMDSEGIYRVSGFHDDVQELKLAFDRYGNDVNLSVYEDINIVAGGLKLYLRELPVPLIPYNLYSRFINAAKLAYSDGQLEAIRRAMDVMPPAHLQTLKHIVQHLARVCDQDGNQMNAQNLGIVFGPTMLRPLEKSQDKSSRYNLNDAQYQKEIVQTIIENRENLFSPHKDIVSIRETHNL